MQREKKESKSQIVYEKIKEMIITNEFPQGASLSERNISYLFESSRTPVREALKRLHNEHFVEITPEFGALVSKITYETILEVYETREVLEGLAARLCALNLTSEERKELEEISNAFIQTMEKKQFDESIPIDLNFHSFLITHCRNSMLMNMINILFDHSRRITRLIDYKDGWAEVVLKQHTEIASCVLEGDADGAEKAMREHIAGSRERQLMQLRR